MFTVEQYRARYARSTSQELLELLAIDPASLTPQARQALADETAQRGLERGMSLIESVGIELDRPRQFLYPKAPLPDRFGAYIVDQIIALGPVITAAIFNFLFHLGTQSPMVRTFNYVATIAWAFYYTCTRDARPNGQSIGKKMFGLMVVNTETDRPCTLGQAIGRGLSLIFLNSIPFVGWLIEPIAATGSSDGRRIGDRLAGTQVIRPSVDDATRHESLDVDEGLGSQAHSPWWPQGFGTLMTRMRAKNPACSTSNPSSSTSSQELQKPGSDSLILRGIRCVRKACVLS